MHVMAFRLEVMGRPMAPAILGRFRSNARNIRLAAIGTIVIVLIVGYVSLLRYFHVSEMPVERDLGARAQKA